MPTDLDEPRTALEQVQEPHPPEQDDEGGPVKSFLDHLEDLRWVLIKSVAAIGISMLICLIAGNQVMAILEWPLKRAKIRYPGTNQVVTVLMGTNRVGKFILNDDQQARYNLGQSRFVDLKVDLVPSGSNFLVTLNPVPSTDLNERQRLSVDLVGLGPIAGFVVALQVALYGGLVLAAPFVFYFIAGFVFPALRMTEKYYVYRGLGFGLFLFLLGVAFCYFVLLHLALAASVSYANWLGMQANQWRAEEYISFVCKFMLGMGIGFQMPVVLLTLVKIGVLNYTLLSKMRRYMIVINLVLGAILTTPEIITQVLMAIPLQILYEITVWIAWYWERREKKKKAQAAG